MNKRARAYLARHSVMKLIDGVSEMTLPLEKLQGFLDLLGPGDLRAGDARFSYHEKLQRLYNAQATWVQTIQEQVAQHDLKAVRQTMKDQKPAHADE